MVFQSFRVHYFAVFFNSIPDVGNIVVFLFKSNIFVIIKKLTNQPNMFIILNVLIFKLR